MSVYGVTVYGLFFTSHNVTTDRRVVAAAMRIVRHFGGRMEVRLCRSVLEADEGRGRLILDIDARTHG